MTYLVVFYDGLIELVKKARVANAIEIWNGLLEGITLTGVVVGGRDMTLWASYNKSFFIPLDPS